jgi:hypothetical protein
LDFGCVWGFAKDREAVLVADCLILSGGLSNAGASIGTDAEDDMAYRACKYSPQPVRHRIGRVLAPSFLRRRYGCFLMGKLNDH